MTGAALIILGAVIGAAATGGVQAWTAHTQRLLGRKVAARAILGDLYLTEALLRGVLDSQRWPMAFDIDRPLETWQEFRGSFAAAASGAEWAEVDSVFGTLHQIGLAATLGHQSVEPAQPLVSGLLGRLEKAREIVARHAADSEKEREEIEAVYDAGFLSSPPPAAGPLGHPLSGG